MNFNKTSYKVMFLSFFFISSLCVSFYYSSLSDVPNEMICWGTVERTTPQSHFDALFTYIFKKNGVGVVVYDGTITDDNKKKKVGVKIYFDYKRNGNNIYVLKSNNIYMLPSIEARLTENNLLPEFYRSENKSYNIEIYKVSKDGYVFIDAQLPFIFCQTKDNMITN